jgi:predicted NUDIX family phosphoesterase
MSTVQTEQVLVVPTQLFHDLGYFQGFSTEVERYFDSLLTSEQVSYRPRDEMEQDPSFKQLIPYVIFRHTDAAGNVSIFEYSRGKGQGESRLHSKRSVGIGGHISSDDAEVDSANVYQEGMARELAEEVVIDSSYESHCVGLINDDETEVGRVHLGVVHILDLARPAVKPAEDDIIARGFQPVDELLADLDGFESWSRICLEALFGPKK